MQSKSVTSNFTLSEGGTCSISQPLIRSLALEVCVFAYTHLCGCVCAGEAVRSINFVCQIFACMLANAVCEKNWSMGHHVFSCYLAHMQVLWPIIYVELKICNRPTYSTAMGIFTNTGSPCMPSSFTGTVCPIKYKLAQNVVTLRPSKM